MLWPLFSVTELFEGACLMHVNRAVGEGITLAPSLIRFGEMTQDEFFVTAGAAQSGVRVVNTGESELRYLAVSTMSLPEVVEYPDSGKFGLLAELPGRAGAPSTVFRFVSRKEAGVGYWEGN